MARRRRRKPAELKTWKATLVVLVAITLVLYRVPAKIYNTVQSVLPQRISNL